MRSIFTLIFFISLQTVFGQTFTSTNSGSFTDTDNWTPTPVVTDFTNGTTKFIVADGHVMTIDAASSISISDLEIGQGAAGATVTFGDGTAATVNSLVLNNSLTIQDNATLNVNNNDNNTHILRIDGDIVNNGGTLDLENGTGLVNTTLGNSTTSVLSGSSMIFNDLTINGGSTIILIASIDVNGDFTLTGIGSNVTTTVNHYYAGDFTVSSSAAYSATSSTQFFDGSSPQSINITGTSTEFNNIIFDNSNKTLTGNLVSTGTFEITADATWTNTGDDHQIAYFEVKNASGVALTGGTITFRNGEIRFGDDTNTDGSFTIGDETNIYITGWCTIERDDQITIDGDLEISGDGYLIVYGVEEVPGVDESDAQLLVTGTRTLTIGANADLYLRGYDNFPTGFTTYNLDKTSLVRYDADFDQIIVGENFNNDPITFGRLYLSQPEASTQRQRELLSTDAVLNVSGQFDLVNGIEFYASHGAIITFNEDLYMDSGDEGDPDFIATDATIILDANTNQVMDGPLRSTAYQIGSLQITNTNTPTALRQVYIDEDVYVETLFSIQNPNGTSANSLVVDIDDNIINAAGINETFTLDSNCKIYTSTDDEDGFAQNFDDGGDIINIDPTSTVRFDRNGDQIIPDFNGGQFGHIEFSGSGNKYVKSNLDIDGDVTRIGGTPIFRYSTTLSGTFQITSTYSHTVAGDWNMGLAYTHDNEATSGDFGTSGEPIITFDGTDQIISSSDFHNITFSGSDTKTITGTLLVDGNVTINTGVAVVAAAESIDIAGDWTENGTGTFYQGSSSTTDFLGGATQTIVQNSNSTFSTLAVTNNTTVNFNSAIQIGRDFDIEDGSTVDIDGQTVSIERDLRINSTATFTYSDPITTTLVFNGDTEQDIRNINAAQNFPSLSFMGVGNKELVNNILNIEGDLTISSEATFQGNSFEINFEGENWNNSGNFQHNNSVNFVNNGGSTTVSASTFHDIEIGENAGTIPTTVLLDGNISLSGEMNIFANTTLDVTTSNYSITVEEDWNNYGVFEAQQGTVVFIGNSSDFRTLSATANSGAQTDKAFYNLDINIASGQYFLIQRSSQVLGEQLDIINDLNIISGTFTLYQNTVPQYLNIAGDFVISGGDLRFDYSESKITMNGTSGAHNIDLGGDQVRDFEINAPGATYQLTGDFNIRDNSSNEITLTDGTLDLNGQTMTINRGGFDMTGGTLTIDEGASLLLNDLAINPDFNKTGGTLEIIGVDGTPATLSSLDAGAFTFTQSGGDIQAIYYTIANTSGDGLRIEGGTIDTGGTGNDFSNGTFTTGTGSAYMTLANLDIGTISSNNVIFNAGPTYNVAIDPVNEPNSGTIEFIVSGGSLAGETFELDNPANGAADGFILWNEDTGMTWTGLVNSDWSNAGNWNDATGDADGIPDLDDIIYIEAGSNDLIIQDTESVFAARVTVRNSGNLILEGTGELTVGGNFTILNGSITDMTNSPNSNLYIGGAWSNGGTFNEGTATVTFNATTGSHSISTQGNGDPFYNMVIDTDATYIAGSIITVSNKFELLNGIFDNSGGFTMYINNQWLVNGGVYKPGQGLISFNGVSGTQSIAGGTMWDVTFEGAANKSIDGNIAANDDMRFVAGSGDVLGNDKTIYVGGDWDLELADGFVPSTGTVIFNGTSGQSLINNGFNMNFNNIIFQNLGTKSIYYDLLVNNNFSIISENATVDMRENSSATIAGILSQTGGNFRIWDSNFPTANSYSLTGGEVDFIQDTNLTIPEGITFNDLEIRALNNVATTALFTGDITVLDDINVSYGAVTLNIDGHTITLGDNISLSDNEILTWNGGTLLHNGGNWYIDTDFNNTDRSFENLTLAGTGLKRPNSGIAINGDLAILDGVEFEQLTQVVTNDGSGNFTMEQNSILDNRLIGDALPTGFASYSLDPTSRVELRAAGDQILNTQAGTLEYGHLYIANTGNVTLDGNLIVQGDFDMTTSNTLIDNNFDITLNGSYIDLQDYTPSVGTTVTFSGTDQLIYDYDVSGENLEFYNVIFAGSGTKTLTPNEGTEVTDISGIVTINSGVTVTTDRGIDFKGTDWTNNGTFNLNINSRPFVFSGGASNFDPGINDIAALTVANSTGTTVSVLNNGLNLGTGDFLIEADATIDFSNLSHTLSSENVVIDPTGHWILDNTSLDFNQLGGQSIPIIDETNSNITGIPSILISGTGTKLLSGDIVIDDLTIGINTVLDIDNTNSYQITVNGNWDNQGGDLYEREGTVIFNSTNTDAKTINVNGEDFATVTFQGSAIGDYTLLDDMQVEGNTTGEGLTLSSATLTLGGFNLTLGDNDTDDPDAEINIIGNNGTLNVDAGATLQFDTNDDGGDIADTEIGGVLIVQSGGVFNLVGASSEVANITRSAGSERIDINIQSGGEIGARYYSIQYLTDEGLEVEDGAIINATNNFSNGTFSNLATDAGNGTGGDDNPVNGNTYLSIESDAAQTISDVIFNFSGTPTVGRHYNVSRSNGAGNLVIDFINTSGPLGRNGATYELDGDPTTPADANGYITWELPNDTQWEGDISTDWTDADNWDNGVPSLTLEAIIGLGQPFNPIIDGTAVNIGGLIISDGILKVINSSIVDLDGEMILGNGTGGAFIMDNTSSVLIEDSWTTSNNAVFDNGEGTVIFDTNAGSSISITPGNQSFHHLTFSNTTDAGDFNIVSNTLTIDGDLTIENSAKIIPAVSNYTFSVAGNIIATTGVFDTNIDGEIILNGTDQTITDMSFDELTISGTGTKTTSGNTIINDTFIIEEGTTFTGGGTVSIAGNVTIEGTFNGITGQTYNFSSNTWLAAPNSYTGEGTVNFEANAGTQYILQSISGDNPVQFHNLTLNGGARIELGQLNSGVQFDGNIDITGDLTVSNTINTLDANNYLIDNTTGTGTFSLASNESIQLTGSDNFPINFGTYALDATSRTYYYGTIDQTIRGDVTYGHVYLYNATTKTLGGNIDVDGDLYMFAATLDASVSNYAIHLAGRWDTNNGNDDGAFISRDATVTFDGDADQSMDIGETGNQGFNDLSVNKSGGNVEVYTSNIDITGSLNVLNGTFDLNNLTATISENVNVTGTGNLASSDLGLYLLNATSGSPTIRSNGSAIGGSFEIDAIGRTYELLDDLTLLGNFTLTKGTLDVNGQTLSLGNNQDAVNIYGTLNVSTAAKPGGTLALGNNVQLVVQPGGSFNLVGTSSFPATLTSTGTTNYLFSVTGTSGSKGKIGAKYYTIEYMSVDGIFINSNTTIDLTNNFSDGLFQNGFSGGKYLRIENDQELTGANRIENIVFDDNPGGGATNIYKATSTSGEIELYNYSGVFSGENFDEDPNNLITWLIPPTVTWTGLVNNDWFNDSNWDSFVVPISSQNVIIPQTLNEPIITDSPNIALADNLTLEINAVLKINTADDDVDIQIGGDLVFESSASLESSGSDDDIEISGSWIRLSTALFTSGTSQVTFNSTAGVETIDCNDDFNDLIINIDGTLMLSADLTITNDLTIDNGTVNLATSDLLVNGNFINNGLINANGQTVSLIPDNTNTRTFNPGASEYYNLIIGQNAGNLAEYTLTSDLIATHDFNLLTCTLDPNTFNLEFGDSDGIQDDVNINGILNIEANESILLDDDVELRVKSNGELHLIGSDLSNIASISRRNIGDYKMIIESGGIFEASFFSISYISSDGVWMNSGSELLGLDNGSFTNGTGTNYLKLSNAFSSDITAIGIAFGVGPTYNVSRTEGAGNNIIFEDASGAFAGPNFEDDDLDPDAGEIRWTYTLPITVWSGATDTDWSLLANWSNGIPSLGSTVQIPDVSGASGNFPVINNTSGDASVASLIIEEDAMLSIDDDRSIVIDGEVTITGTFTITGTSAVDVGGSWTNNGLFNPGTSHVTLGATNNTTISGGSSFYDLTIDGAGTGAGIIFTTASNIDINNNLNITDGVLQIVDASHDITIGGDFTLDDSNGSYLNSLSIITFDGDNQNIGNASETVTIPFSEIVIAGTGTKTVQNALDIDGDLSIATGSTLSLASQNLTFSGSTLDVDGAINVNTGTSSLTFDGTDVQIISGSSSSISLDNLVIQNTAIGNNDIQLNLDLRVNENVDFRTGIIQSSGSNPLIFIDNATVSYDGSPEALPNGSVTDGNSFAVGPIIKIGDEGFIFPIGEGARIARMGISGISDATVTDQYSAEYFYTTAPNSDATKNGSIVHVSHLEYWDLSNLNAHNGKPKVTLSWDASSDVTNPSALTIAHYNGSSWDDEGNGSTVGSATLGSITSINNFTSFSPIALASTDAEENPLPVELLSFNAEALESEIELSWITLSEIQNDYFIIERSKDGTSFEKAGQIKGNGTTNEQQSYSYIDRQPLTGTSFYRLRQVDFDGNEELSEIIKITFDNMFDQSEISFYPNPTNQDNINIRISTVDENSLVQVQVYSMTGRIVHKEEFNSSLGINEYQIHPNGTIGTGIFQVIIIQGNHQVVKKIIIN